MVKKLLSKILYSLENINYNKSNLRWTVSSSESPNREASISWEDARLYELDAARRQLDK